MLSSIYWYQHRKENHTGNFEGSAVSKSSRKKKRFLVLQELLCILALDNSKAEEEQGSKRTEKTHNLGLATNPISATEQKSFFSTTFEQGGMRA